MPAAIPSPLAGRPFAPDPFEPLLSLWATGYVLDAVMQDALVLVSPEA